MSTKSDRRARWDIVLQRELDRWSAKNWNELAAELKDGRVYEVKTDSGTLQVEVEILENTTSYIHVMVAVDDGHLPEAVRPACSSFICQRDFHGASEFQAQ